MGDKMKLMLIGGGEIGRGNTSYTTENIDKEIVKMAEKDKPNLLFIGLASSYSDSYYDYIKKIYTSLGCTTAYLKKKNIINNRQIVEDKINSADIIYIGGGDSIKLINEVKEYEIDELLKKAVERNCVMAGISAGAILLSKKGYSDSYILRGEKSTYEFIEGLSFTDLVISPHYNIEEKKNSLKKQKEEKLIYGLEDNTALKIVDNNIEVIKSDENANVYNLSLENEIIENIL